jgi:hypothetical protein
VLKSSVLGHAPPNDLLRTLKNRSLNIFQRVSGNTRTYEEIVSVTADKHGVRRRLFESDQDLERRLIRFVSNRVLSAMSPEQRGTYLREMHSNSHTALAYCK